MQDETVLFDPESNRFMVLNQTAACMWRRLETPASCGDLTDAVCSDFEIQDRAAVEQDVRVALEEFSKFAVVMSPSDA